jgi:hypothetical protein
MKHLDMDVLNAVCQRDGSLSIHWNISTLSKQLFEECFLTKWKEEILCLIVYDITNVIFNGHNANKWKKVPVERNKNHLFLTLPSHKTYIVDIVVPLSSSSYYTILRSNTIHLGGSGSRVADTDMPAELSEWQLHPSSSQEWAPLFSTYSCYTKNTR